MMRPSLLPVAVVLALAAPAAGTGQTPEQRYDAWATPTFPADVYAARRQALLDALAPRGLALLVPSADGATSGETFHQLDDFMYLTGLEVPASFLILDGAEGLATLFVPGRDFRFENPGRPNDFPGRPLGEDPSLAALTGTRRITSMTDLEPVIEALVKQGRTLAVNGGRSGDLEPPTPAWVGTLGPVETLLLRLGSRHPDAGVENAFQEVARLRMRKGPEEVERLTRAADATAQAIRATAGRIRPGVTEASLQGVFEGACRDEGALQIPFTPIIKSGPNSLWPWRILAAHADRRNRALEAGELVILDVGCAVDGYVSDVGRTFPVDGTFTPVQREKLVMATAVSDAVIAAVRPGVTLPQLTQVAYQAIPEAERPYMQAPSFFGHHLGLSTGDPSLLDEPLAEGMVFTIEPWYYNHDLGVSVFVEDVILVTASGARVLTRALPRSPEELERMVR